MIGKGVLIFGIGIFLFIGVLAFILLSRPTENQESATTSNAVSNNSESQDNKKLKGNQLVEAILNEVKSEVSTIEKTRIYTEDTDSNNMLGKSGQYQYAGAFYDSRTVDDGVGDYSESDDYGTDAGGVVEVYASDSDAQARDNYLAQFKKNTGFLNPGEYRVVGNVVLRVSARYKASEQQEMLNLMERVLK